MIFALLVSRCRVSERRAMSNGSYLAALFVGRRRLICIGGTRSSSSSRIVGSRILSNANGPHSHDSLHIVTCHTENRSNDNNRQRRWRLVTIYSSQNMVQFSVSEALACDWPFCVVNIMRMGDEDDAPNEKLEA